MKKTLVATFVLCCLLLAFSVSTASASGDGFSVAIDTSPLDEAGYEYEDQGEDGLMIYVPPEGEVTLQVSVSAADDLEITYEWFEEIYRHEEYNGTSYAYIEDATTAVFTIDNTKTCRYFCEVSDQYGNSERVWFSVCVESFLSAEIDDSEGNWKDGDLYVSYGDSATIKIDADADDPDGITYSWYVYDNDGYHYQEIPDAKTSTLVVDNVTGYTLYKCCIYDKYNNRIRIWIRVHIDNHLSARADTDAIDEAGYDWEKNGNDVIVYGPIDSPVDFTVIAEADPGTIITYEWWRDIFDENGDWVDDEPLDCSAETLVVGSLTTFDNYYCYVRDQYGNEEIVCFNISFDNHLTLQTDTAPLDEAGYEYEDWGYGLSVFVAPNSSLTLKVQAHADTPDSITRYSWLEYDKENGWYEECSPVINGDTMTIQSVTGQTRYLCYVYDCYGNYDNVHFYVFVENSFSAKVDTAPLEAAGYRYSSGPSRAEVYVKPGDQVTFKVDASAEYGQLSYEWYKYDDNGFEERIDDATTDSLTVSVAKYCVYCCDVCDQYGNSERLWFTAYVDNNLSAVVDTAPFAEAEYDYSDWVDSAVVYVPFEESVTFKVSASADDDSAITYQWREEIYDEDDDSYYSVDVDGATSDTLVIDSITKLCKYDCHVCDQYGNGYYIQFTACVVNNLNAKVDTTPFDTAECEYEAGYNYANVYVPFGGSITLKVIANADEGQIAYEWHKDDGNGETEIIDGATSNTLVTDSVTGRCRYWCNVSDQYGNSESVWYRVYVNNHFIAAIDTSPFEAADYDYDYESGSNWVNVYVPLGNTILLKVDASSDDNLITYEWWKEWYDEDEDTYYNDIIPDATSGMLTVSVAKYCDYWCDVCDQYGNTKQLFYDVFPIDPDGYTLTLKDYTKDSAVIDGIIDGGKYIGEKTFTVTSEQACVVAYKAASDEDYTVLTASGSGSSRSFTVQVDEDTEIFIGLVGDVDLDGVVGRKDATLLSRFVAQWKDIKVDPLTADIDGAGGVARKDATLLSRRIAGWTTVKDYFVW